MDKQTFRVLEFDKIFDMAASYALTAPGKVVIKNIKPLDTIDAIRSRISNVSEYRFLFSQGRPPGIEHIDDLLPLFKRIKPADAVLEPFEYRSFIPLFVSAMHLKALNDDKQFPGLGVIAERINTHTHLERAIESAIDREGQVRDEASPELAQIRGMIKALERKINALLEDLLTSRELEPHLQDKFITQRNNRWVVPVKIDSKGSVPGIVHDISNTGETAFIEPYSVQTAGNELESCRAEEKLEVFRVLRRLSLALRESLDEIENDYALVAELDALQSSARFSDQMGMSAPEINEKGLLKINSGRHPLLWRALNKSERKDNLVPLDLELGKQNSSMVITGSNAGGKTVALKTTGVLSLMALCGMHIPAESGTTIPFLQRLYANIGDDQSIENNLSTFSAHITRIAEIVRKSGENTLVIIDELGTGTDPEQGGALSCAILRKLMKKKTLSVISTHLGMLKVFAHSEEGIVNSAMIMEEIDLNGAKSHRPTYKLLIGEPGTSHAFEIAESLGLDREIILEARKFVTGEGLHVESLISTLKEKEADVRKRLKEIETIKRESGALKSSMEKERSDQRTAKNEIMSRALNEAEEIIRKTKVEASDILMRMKKSKLTEAARETKALDLKHSELKKMSRKYSPEKSQRLNKIIAGQDVFIPTLGLKGIIQSVNEKSGKCRVVVDGKEITVSAQDLYEPPKETQGRINTRTGDEKSINYKASYSSVDADFPHELNLIGQRVEPALSLLDRYLNDASLSGAGKVKIVHGVGTGRLSQAIRDFAESHPLVERFEKGGEGDGGEAVTIVYF